MFKKDEAKIKKLFNSLNSTDEFEVMFNNYKIDNKLPLDKFVNILKYMKWRSDNDKIKIDNTDTLDISYNYEKNNAYRVSINSNDTINSFLNVSYTHKNNSVFSLLITEFQNNKNFTFIKKQKDTNKIMDFDDYDIRFRVSSEIPLDTKIRNSLSNLPISTSEKISYRYKNRVSLKLIDTDKEHLYIDLTVVKTSNSINTIHNGNVSYELEIDYSTSKKSNEASFKKIIDEIVKIKQVLEETSELSEKSETEKVKKNYLELVYGKNTSETSIYTMQPISAKVQNIVDKIPNKYSVTDKADGVKYTLFVDKGNMYLLSTNLDIKKISNTIKGYDNTIIEGELIHLPASNKYMFMMFDTLFFKNQDIRPNKNLRERIEYLVEFGKVLSPNTFKYEDYVPDKKGYNIKSEKKFYQEKIEEFYTTLNKLIEKQKQNDIIFYPKLFLYPTGASSSQVFLYSYLIWYNCTQNEKTNCPYNLDGIIYTGLEQEYSKNRQDQKYPTYKYKPPEMNSIDVYIEFQVNKETNKYLDVFDNSITSIKNNRLFRIVNFFVGDRLGGREVPTLFMPNEKNHEAFLPIINGQVRDIEGNMVHNKTVVEIIYNNDPNIPHQYRWQILRTRWFKTNSVIRNKTKYGNFKHIAADVWYSMVQAVTTKELKNLADPDSYDLQLNQLKERIDSRVIATEKAQDVYYAEIEKIAKKMREFHNWTKSILIYTYCQKYREVKDSKLQRTRILDIGVGVGGDGMKMIHAKVAEWIGIDPDYDGLFTSLNNATSRYENWKSKYPVVPRSVFIQASGDVLLVPDSQEKAFPNMPKENKDKIKREFSKKQTFDVINAQFSIHYMFSSDEGLNNLIDNIKHNLKIGGYVVCTLFDSEQVMELLGKKDRFTSYYTDENGNKKKFFEIVKKFEGDPNDKTGKAIDVFMSWINDRHIQEYLVTKELMLSSMKKAGCYLVDTDLFQNIFEINRDYFDKVIPHEENPKNKQFYERVAQYYGELTGYDKESKIYTKLNRFYIFKRLE